ncbi:MAG: hypothetical protein JRH15_10845 [Deltaproteobacteria bacterium]|nr:hypothetical protein [Deltaproteobacteria bacterium]
MAMTLEPKRGYYVDISRELGPTDTPLTPETVSAFEFFDLVYRSLCALLFNYAPTSGHPGGSISSGRFVSGILFDAMAYDLSDPDRADADIISYAAGHKALGIYAMWSLRNEVARIAAPELLPSDTRLQLRLEDLLGFRRNPITDTPLYKQFNAKPLDGHPTPATPFLKLATGASGVGMSTSLGLAFGAMDFFGKDNAPTLHIVEGEGGMTPGRVSEALAAAGTASLQNAVLHLDWNQASIDSNHVCRSDGVPGDYVQWTPMELAYINDWNVILVPDGKDFQQILAAQRKAAQMDSSQPTAIVYRTIKGWQYGIEGKGSHGAGHGLCQDGFYSALEPLMAAVGKTLPRCDREASNCRSGQDKTALEDCFWNALQIIRSTLEARREVVDVMANRLTKARDTLDGYSRNPRENAPRSEKIYEVARQSGAALPAELALEPGSKTTLREALGNVLRYYNSVGDGAILAASADLLGSTSVSLAAKDYAEGFFNATTNPEARLLSIGGICEDAMAGIMAGLSTYGRHMGVGSSYGAFIAALGHIPARLHAIGSQARTAIADDPFHPFMLICGHAGLKTGEDGPTHADPQPLQLLQENFPPGTMVTLTPWDPQELWPLVTAALAKRPAVIAPFVTRPAETIVDREALGLAPVANAKNGVYQLKKANGKGDGTLVLQGSEVCYAFVQETLPLLKKKGIDLNVYYIASTELFDMLSPEARQEIFPGACADTAMGITGFTLPTMYRWIRSDRGRRLTLHPFRKGTYLGSGPAEMVLTEAGLDGESQYRAILKYVE